MELVLQTRDEVHTLVQALAKLVDDYGSFTVEDLCELAGVHTNEHDQSFGWTTITTILISQKRDGWHMTFETPTSIRKD